MATQKYKYLIKDSMHRTVVKTNDLYAATAFCDNNDNQFMLVEVLKPIMIGRHKMNRTKVLRRITNQIELL